MKLMMMEYDPEAGATYLQISDAPVARTRAVSDAVNVDLDEHGKPVGVELLVPPGAIDKVVLDPLFETFPQVESMIDRTMTGLAQI